MDAQQRLTEHLNAELMALLGRVQSQLPGTGEPDEIPLADVLDIYTSAVTGHLFSVLLTGMSPGFKLDVTPESVAKALRILGQKLSGIAQAIDRTGDYQLQILRRDR